MSPLKNIALIGGTGTVGAPILSALISPTSPFSSTTFVLNRASSRSTYSTPARILTVPDDLSVEALTSVFATNRIDALVIAIAGSRVEESRRLIDAAFAGGVRTVIPAEFGSCDSADARTNELIPLFAGKNEIREYLVALSQRDRPRPAAPTGTAADGRDENGEENRGRLTWTALVTGHFFDWGLSSGLLNIDVRAKKAYVLDGGDVRFSASTLSFIAGAVLRVLEYDRPDRAALVENKLLYVHGLHVTQNEVLAALEKAMGERFEVLPRSSAEEMDELVPRVKAGDKEAVEEAVAVWGIVASDWASKKGFANESLELEGEDLEAVVQRVVANM